MTGVSLRVVAVSPGASAVVAGAIFLVAPLVAAANCHPLRLSSKEVDATPQALPFDRLSPDQRRLFERTLEETTVPVESGNAANLGGETVAYRGAYYRVTEIHVECGELRPLCHGIEVALLVAGLLTVSIVIPASED